MVELAPDAAVDCETGLDAVAELGTAMELAAGVELGRAAGAVLAAPFCFSARLRRAISPSDIPSWL